MTHQEKEALLKRIYALPTGWADGGGSYGKGGPVGSEDAAMLWSEAVIDAINQFADDTNVARSPWAKTSDRLPTEADAGYDDEIIILYQDGETKMLGFDYWKYVAKFPEQYLYWMPIPPLPEVEG